MEWYRVAVTQIPSILQMFYIWIGLSKILYKSALSHNKEKCPVYNDDLECIDLFSSWSSFLTIVVGLSGSLCIATMLAQNNFFPFIGLGIGIMYWGMFVKDLTSGQIHERATLLLLAGITWILSVAYLIFALSIPP